MCSGAANNKKYAVGYFVAIVTIIFVMCTFLPNTIVSYHWCHAEESIEEQLSTEVDNILDDIDFSDLENYYNSSKEIYDSCFGTKTFKEFLTKLMRGEIFTEFDSVFSAIFALIRSNLTKILSPILLILVILLLSAVFKSIRPKVSEFQVASVIFFVCYGVVAVIIAGLMTSIIGGVTSAITSMKNQCDFSFPIVMLLMNASGGVASVKAYQPMVLLLSNFVSSVFTKLLLPICIVVFVLGLVGSISKNSKLSGFIEFFTSAFKWVIGIVFTIYIGFMSIQGITASTADGISIKTAKFAIKNYVPVLGGYISDGFELAKAGALIVKNAIGFSGIFAMALFIAPPVLMIATVQLALKLVIAVVEPVASSRSQQILKVSSKSLSMLLTVLIGVFMMYFVSMMLLIFSLSGANL